MFWADELAARLTGPQVVNDSKTPSGTVHVGSLRGPVILDVIVRALRAHELPTTLLYGVDVNEETLAIARTVGAEHAVPAGTDVRELTEGGAHVSLDALGLEPGSSLDLTDPLHDTLLFTHAGAGALDDAPLTDRAAEDP